MIHYYLYSFDVSLHLTYIRQIKPNNQQIKERLSQRLRRHCGTTPIKFECGTLALPVAENRCSEQLYGTSGQ